MTRWPLGLELSYLVDVVRGKLARGDAGQVVDSLVHDSRQDVSGAMFVAITGENFDGHGYVAQAARSGASGALVSRDVDLAGCPETFFVVQADDTVEALGRLGRERRRRFAGPVIAVAGSVGKTTTKEMIARVLSGSLKVHKTAANLNNLIGAPLTLLETPDDSEAIVIELGMNQPGELERLTRVAEPSVGVLTGIGLAHVGMFDGEEGLIRAKSSFVIELPEGATLVCSADCDRSRRVIAEHAGARPVIWVGLSETADVRIERVKGHGGGYTFALRRGDEEAAFALSLFGRHNVQNAAMAAAVALGQGVGLDRVAERLQGFQPYEMRSEMLVVGGVRIVADCYNASPESACSAVVSLAETPTTGKRLAILGDMLELGNAAEEIHRRLGRLFGQHSIDRLVTVGELSVWTAEEAEQAGQATQRVSSAEEAAEAIAGIVAPGDVVLVKGGRRMKLENAIERLKAEIEPGGEGGDEGSSGKR